MPKDRALPTQPVAGDLIRVKPESMKELAKACEAAGYAVDLYAIREVTRVDHWAPGGGNRLFVDGAPHCFLPRDGRLAWNLEADRKEMLLKRGWKHEVTAAGESWLAP